MYDHTAADIGDVELFDIVPAQIVAVHIKIGFVEQGGKLAQQRSFVVARKGLQVCLRSLFRLAQNPYRNTDDFPELSKDTRPLAVGRFPVRLPKLLSFQSATGTGLGLPKFFEMLRQLLVMLVAGHRFYVQKQYLVEIDLFHRRSGLLNRLVARGQKALF